MSTPTLLRNEEHAVIQKYELHGHILDLGGDARSEYRIRLGGNHDFISVNLDPGTNSDLTHNLEELLPLEDASFDHALLMNVLEHIYNYKQLLSETYRVIKPGGSIVVVVPFFFPVHPSPNDYRRFTAQALEEELREAGFTEIEVHPLGSGVFAACYVAIDRLMPSPIRLLNWYTVRYIVRIADWLFIRLAKLFRKQYKPSDYALGYCARARR